MKLKNKKTGDIWEFDGGFSMIASHETAERAGGRGCSVGCHANSLAELNENWEDYKPTEPLIKDEKIRKAVRAWAEANEIGPQEIIRFNAIEHRLSWISTAIEFNEFEALSDLEKEDCTITELCGEEEE